MKTVLVLLALSLSAHAAAKATRVDGGVQFTSMAANTIRPNKAGFYATSHTVRLRLVNGTAKTPGTLARPTSGGVDTHAPLRVRGIEFQPLIALPAECTNAACIYQDNADNLVKLHTVRGSTITLGALGTTTSGQSSLTPTRVEALLLGPQAGSSIAAGETGFWLDLSDLFVKTRLSDGTDTILGAPCADLSTCGNAGVVGYPSGVAACAFSTAFPGCVPVDGDGDGLMTAWETSRTWLAGGPGPGIDLDCNNVYDDTVDLRLPGADPTIKDIYTQFDYMTNSGLEAVGKHTPPSTVIDASVAVYAAVGIVLHIDPVHQSLPHYTTTTLDSAVPCVPNGDYTDINDLKAIYFDPKRALAYHYSITAHFNTCSDVPNCTFCSWVFNLSGIAELPGNDSIVSFGTSNFVLFGSDVHTRFYAGAYVHEFGHQLGLRHHGDVDGPARDPIYISVMNLRYELAWILAAVAAGTTTPQVRSPYLDPGDLNNGRAPDYAHSPLDTIDEAAMDEFLGVSVGGVTGIPAPYTTDIVTYNCPVTNVAAVGAGTGPVDWNCDGMITNPVSGNITGVVGAPLQILGGGQDDWSALFYDFQCTSGFAAGGAVVPKAAKRRRASATPRTPSRVQQCVPVPVPVPQ